jgi:acyl carrier protein
MHHRKFLVILRFKLTQNNMSDIASKVRSIIVDKLGVDENEVTPEASFTNDLGADSLDTVELIMEFEKEFNLSIPDDQAENIQTVGQAITYLESNAK